MKWILASASPRRRDLLGAFVNKFKVIPSNAEEKVTGVTPDVLVQTLAKAKASEVASRRGNRGKFVVGADTIVVLDGEILGKPKNEEDARRMLTALSGRSHEVYMGVCIAKRERKGVKTLVDFDCTKVTFCELNPEFIEGYIASGAPMDKAGGYGIQDGGLVAEIHGSYTNVVGLPKELVGQMIERVKREWK